MAPPCILITGANKGIGLALVRRCLKRAPDVLVVLACRSRSRGAAAIEVLVKEDPGWGPRTFLIECDTSSDDSVKKAAEELSQADAKFQKLSAIVNNAGIAYGSTKDILNVNVLGPKRVDDAFLPFLDMDAPGKPRIVQMSSGAAVRCVQSSSPDRRTQFMDTETTTWDAIVSVVDMVANDGELTKKELKKKHGIGAMKGVSDTAYGLSKALLNLYTAMRAKECGDKVRVNACSPGAIATDLFNSSAMAFIMRRIMSSPDAGTKSSLMLLFEEGDGKTGQFYHKTGQRRDFDKY